MEKKPPLCRSMLPVNFRRSATTCSVVPGRYERKSPEDMKESARYVHRQKSFRNLIKSNGNQIVFSIFRLIWNQKNVRLVPIQSENEVFSDWKRGAATRCFKARWLYLKSRAVILFYFIFSIQNWNSKYFFETYLQSSFDQIMVQRIRISIFEKIGAWEHYHKSGELIGWKKEE